MKRMALMLVSLLWFGQGLAGNANVRVWSTDQPLERAYPVISKHLQQERFFVVFEPDIQANLERFAERWGDDYNRNKLEGIRAMVFCNGWYANQMSNADPDMLALCPLHITLVEKSGHTRVLFLRPGTIAAGSNAQTLAEELETQVAKAIDAAMNELRGCPATC